MEESNEFLTDQSSAEENKSGAWMVLLLLLALFGMKNPDDAAPAIQNMAKVFDIDLDQFARQEETETPE